MFTFNNLKKKPLIIAGPCSAESEEQLYSTCIAISQDKRISALRAGIWKPRTRPNSFEGCGEIALPWLKEAGTLTGLPVATEVANAYHVEQCLKNKIDILWIGARTTVNPFSVQEIADCLKGVDVQVMIKNPVNPDLQLWLGAIERISYAGISKIIAVHRGFTSYQKSTFRNHPMWELAIEFKTIAPDIPIICDPSHIAGNRELIPYVCQKALDLDMQGLMIESHVNPANALSDAQQQLTPSDLSILLDSITLRNVNLKDVAFNSKLEELRSKIDLTDEELIGQLAKRMELVKRIGEYKRDNSVTILQIKRWEEIIAKRMQLGSSLGLNETFIRKFLQLLHEESISRQTEIMNGRKIDE